MPIHRITASSPCVEVILSANGMSGTLIATIDSGASMSALHPEIIEGFGIRPIGGVDLEQVDSDGGIAGSWVPTYLFDMIFDGVSMPTPVEVLAAAPASPCDMLIGRDYLGQWLMVRDGLKDILTISYRTIDPAHSGASRQARSSWRNPAELPMAHAKFEWGFRNLGASLIDSTRSSVERGTTLIRI